MKSKTEESSTLNTDKDDLDKRRPKPFRYIADLSELSEEEFLSTTVMSTTSDHTVQKLIEQFDTVVGVGDVNAIEKVLKKHEKRNKKHDPSIG